MIEVKNLVKRYGSHMAVDHLNFTIEKGQIVGFLGPNGAGKSTTMNMITGYIPPTSGTVLVDGHDIGEEPMLVKKSIGYLPEVPPLYPEMRVREYLKFVAELKGTEKRKRDESIDTVMEMTDITDRAGQLIKHLSKGYKQRVGLSGAIIGNPDVIILDEPTVGLDPMQIIEIRDLIKRLAREHTVILSSHILSEVSAVCDQIMIMNKGRLVVSDTTQNLTARMQGGQNIKLLIKGEMEKIEYTLTSIDGVKETIAGREEGGLVTVTVVSDGEQDLREAVFYALAEAKCPVFEMKADAMSLEDIFLAVTKDENGLVLEELKADKIEIDETDAGEVKMDGVQEEKKEKEEENDHDSDL